MARTGIDKAAVQRARQLLIARGEHPSIDAVRIELGNTGSKTTIHRYLKELEPVSLNGMTSLSEPLGKLVEQLAAQLQEEGQARIDAVQAEVDNQRRVLESQLQLARQALGELQVRLTDKEEQVRSLEAKHRQAHEDIEHLRASNREQREQDQRRHETQVRQLQGQLQTVQLGMTARQEELTRLHRDNERLQAEQRQAQSERKVMGEQLEQRDAQVQGLRAILGQAQGASEEIRRQLEAERQRCAEQDRQLARLGAGTHP
ncbi:DNA-binding protein [Pseudomonas entomophila]|uniref:DNA-binding protein n=1 Tax=Pseudomonas entomophila TaxID=312306 RepID=UPI002405615A|nr:DNA-binding protein [Pseudomonas entomophila]MDF9616328.1 DNA-binding protein [Pseudomonas entomophila]